MNTRSPNVARLVGASLWAIYQEWLEAQVERLKLQAAGVAVAASDRPAGQRRRAEGVAVIPIHGMISQRASLFSELFGGTSTEGIGAMLAAAVASPDVGTIVFDVDSPGGTVYGVPELAAQIFAARDTKRVVASVSGLGASAAYWLASQAQEIVASPSSEVGSIGVYSAHIDLTGALEQEGVKVEIFAAGKYKAEGAMGQALTDDARAAEQARVDEMYGLFVTDVARGRGVKSTDVRGGFGEGRIVSAKQAKALGMVDRVGTLEETVARYLRRAAPRGGANADTLRKGLALKALAHGPVVS